VGIACNTGRLEEGEFVNPEDAGQMFNMGSQMDQIARMRNSPQSAGVRLVNLTDKNIVDGRLDLQRLKGGCHTSQGLAQLHLGHKSAGSTLIYLRDTESAKSEAVMQEAMKGLAS
jgi:hypothetical protein